MNAKVLCITLLTLCCVASARAKVQTKYIQMVRQEPTTLTLTASATPTVGSTVTITAKVSPVVSGPVAFSISHTVVPSQSVALDATGNASWTITIPAPGTYTILAQYAGDPNHTGSSSVLTEVVNYAGAPDFTLAVSPGVTVAPGSTWHGVVSLKALNGFSGAVKLACGSGLDPTMKCNFASGLVTPSAGGTSTDLAISTATVTVTVVSGALLPLFAWLPLGDTKRRKWRAVALGLLASLALAGCGARRQFVQSNGTPPGTYYVDITGTSGSISHTVEAKVVVAK